MLKKRYIGAAVACALAMSAFSSSALATPQDIYGVTIDPSSPVNLSIDAINFRESSVQNVGDVLTGYGKLASINTTYENTFCPGCDIGFEFSYTVKDVDNSGPNKQITFDNGTINFYVDKTSSFDANNPNSAHNGYLWLTLSGHAAPRSGFSDPDGELYSTVHGGSVSAPTDANGYGLLDSTGGLAMNAFDTNAERDGADFAFNSSFLTKIFDGCGTTPSDDPDSICHYPISGTGELVGSTAVPEPATIGMMGLGLGFLGLALRRRRKESDDRA